MNFIEASVAVLLFAVLSVPLATRFRIPLEIFLFAGSCIISFLTGITTVTINPTIIFEVFLPPILFSAAYFTSWRDFKFNLRPIMQLAFGLVIFTTCTVAVIAKIILPMLSWPEAFLLGAILSPTDASAATSIIKKFNVPRRFIVLLEGESLINDATALILYRFSLAAILYGSFSFSTAIGHFVLMSTGAVAIGLSIAMASVFIVKRIQNTHAETTFTFITAFSSYLIAERLHCSGVISTVVAGMYLGIHFPEISGSRTRVNTKASWDTLLFVVNGFIFTLIGFGLPSIMQNLKIYPLSDLIYFGVIISLGIILTRLIWIYPSAYLPRVIIPAINRKDPMPKARFLFALGWVGMRGIVSLAAALAIPRQFNINGLPQHLDLIIFIVYFAVIVTLIIPAFTIPFLIRLMGISNADELNEKMQQKAKAQMTALTEINKTLMHIRENENIPREVYHEFINQLERKRRVIQTQITPSPYSMLQDDFMAYKKLVHIAIDTERKILMKLRKTGEIHDEVFWNMIAELDIEELRSNTMRA